MVSAVERLFFTVTFEAALFTPTIWFGNEMLVGVAVTGAIPVPLRATLCGLLFPVSTMVRVAARDPRADGVNLTEIIQVLAAPSVAGGIGQVFVCV